MSKFSRLTRSIQRLAIDKPKIRRKRKHIIKFRIHRPKRVVREWTIKKRKKIMGFRKAKWASNRIEILKLTLYIIQYNSVLLDIRLYKSNKKRYWTCTIPTLSSPIGSTSPQGSAISSIYFRLYRFLKHSNRIEIIFKHNSILLSSVRWISGKIKLIKRYWTCNDWAYQNNLV